MTAAERVETGRQRTAAEWGGLKKAVTAETGLRLEAIAWPLLIAGFAIGMEAARRLVGRTGG